MASLKEAHEEQLQQLMSETKAKVEGFKTQLAAQAGNLQQMQQLQKCVQEQESQKHTALQQFEEYKQQVEERESMIKAEYTQKVTSLAKEVMESKRDFERKMESIEELRDQYRTEKLNALAELEEQHRREVERLLQSKEADQGALDELRTRLEAQHKEQVEKLQDQLRNLDADKKRLVEEYEGKLSKAQAFYEKELDVLRRSQSASHEEQVKLLQEQYDKLKKDLEFQESQSKRRVDDLLSQLSMAEEDIGKYKDEINSLQTSLQNKDSSSTLLNKQVLKLYF